MLQPMRTHLSRLKRQNDSDKRICGRCRIRLIAHANRTLSEKWIRFRVGSGIQRKKRSGGRRLLSRNSQQKPRRRQLHKQIPEAGKQNPHLLRGNESTRVVANVAAGPPEEGETYLEVNLFLLAMLDYVNYTTSVMSATLQFWKPGTLGPGSSLDRTSGEEDAFIPSAAPSQRDRLPIAKYS
jgi:hypothetical protein